VVVSTGNVGVVVKHGWERNKTQRKKKRCCKIKKEKSEKIENYRNTLVYIFVNEKLCLNNIHDIFTYKSICKSGVDFHKKTLFFF
jgi:hypothetical protein